MKRKIKMPDKKQEKPDIKLSDKLIKIVAEIEKLSVLELNDLVKALEEKFGVSAAAPANWQATPTTTTAASAEAGGAEAAPAGQTTFNVVLTSPGANKISVIKMVREINQTLGLKEAKDLVESTPKEVLTAANKENAEEAKNKLEKAGATVELK